MIFFEKNWLKNLHNIRKGCTFVSAIAKIVSANAEVAQLVEHDLAKVGVASSNLVSRSKVNPGGGIGRHAGLKIL